MRRLAALKVEVGDMIHMKNPIHPRKYKVTGIDYGPGTDPHVKYPLFKTKDGPYSYLLVRIAQDRKGGTVV